MSLFKIGEISYNQMTKVNSNVSVANKYQKGSNPLSNIKYTDKVKKQMSNSADAYHNFALQVDKFGASGVKTAITGGDGIVRTKIQIPGSVNGTNGVFEYIIDSNNVCNHRLFVEFK